jgi:hypothetical protein
MLFFLTLTAKMIDFLCFNATFSNISAIPWRPVLVVEEAAVPGENHKDFDHLDSHIIKTCLFFVIIIIIYCLAVKGPGGSMS